jgi:hypothetical protein
MLLVGTDAQLLYPANTFLSTKANRSTPPLLQGQLGAGGMSYRKYENPLEPPMDQIPPALRAGAVDLAVGFIPGLRFGARQQLLFESDYVALARLGHPGVETISNVQGDFSQRVNMRLREPKESAPPSSRGRCASMGLIYYRSTCAAFSHASDDRGGPRSGRDGTEASGCASGGCGTNRDSIASAQASEARHQTVLARTLRCRARTDVIAKDVESGRKRQSVTAAAQQMILLSFLRPGHAKTA